MSRSDAPPVPPGSGAALLTVSALAGAATMVVELAAVRLLAPWFGTSLVVWTNVIAVILLALAVGYLGGSRLAARPVPVGVLGWSLLVAAALVAWLPALGAAVAARLLPSEVALHEAAGLVGWGSLAVSVLVFLPPAALLGTVSPLVVESLARWRHLSAGRAGGVVLCVSTLGSLVGVFGTSHVLLPVLGLRGTFLLAGGGLFLAGAGALFLARGRRAAPGAAVVLALAALAPLAPPPRPGTPPGRIELARRESPYQSLRVVEDRSGPEPLRWLQVNEGFDSFQSVWQESPGLLPEGYYYNDFLLPLGWSPPVERWDVLVLGLGGGTVLRVFEAAHGLDAHFVGIELDPAVVELGRSYLGLAGYADEAEVHGGLDARVALNASTRAFDQIVLDCYANQVEIPAHLCTLEFFRTVRARLRPGGWLTANLGGFDFDDPVVAAVAETCARAFEQRVVLVRVPRSRNFMLLARSGAPLPWDGETLAAAEGSAPLPLGPRRLPRFARVVEPGSASDVLTDDHCPIERLQLRSIAEAAERRRGDGS